MCHRIETPFNIFLLFLNPLMRFVDFQLSKSVRSLSITPRLKKTRRGKFGSNFGIYFGKTIYFLLILGNI